jgi:alkylhydroperoxidase family enzyme
VFRDVDSAPVSARVRAGLRLTEILALRPDELSRADLDAARAAGLDDAAIRDVSLVSTMFAIITRLADTLNFALPPSFDDSVKVLTSKMGYRLPPPLLLLPRA